MDWFKSDGWTVWQEVPAPCGTADIVVEKAGVLAVVEAKTSMSLALIGQAKRWIGHCHMVYVAVPRRKYDSTADGANWVCNLTGVGLLFVGSAGGVREAVVPNFFRKPKSNSLRKALRPEQQDGSIPAGTNSGKAWTPWRVTVTALARRVAAEPGITLADALEGVKTHYSSPSTARRCLSKLALRGLIPGIRASQDGKFLRLYPK